MRVLRALRVLLVTALAVTGCKGDTRKHGSAPAPSPRAPIFPALPPAATATLEPPAVADGGVRSPAVAAEPPSIVVWRGSNADTPTTEISLRVWPDGTVRFKCGRRGVLPRERVSALVSAFATAGWNTAATSDAEPGSGPQACVTTTVQVTHGGITHRRKTLCNARSPDIEEAVALVESVVGPDPCP